MNNNVMKLIICTGFFCNTTFGMEKEPNLYVECNNGYGTIYYCGIHKNGTVDDVDDKMTNVLKSSKIFKGNFTVEDGKYLVQLGIDYASEVMTRRKNESADHCVSLDSSDFYVPIELTEEQLKKMVQLRQENSNIFVLDNHKCRLTINDVSLDDLKKQQQDRSCTKERLPLVRNGESYDIREKCTACEKCCVLALIPVICCGWLFLSALSDGRLVDNFGF